MSKKQNKFGLIIASLIMAIFLWSYIMGEESVEITKRVPLIIKTPEGVSIANEINNTVSVRLLVPRNMISLLETRPVEVIHSVTSDNVFGNFAFDLSSQDVKRPSSLIRVLQIIPERMMVKLDQVIEKKLPIIVRFANEPAEGYKVDKESIQIDPNVVLVSGAKSVLEKMDFIYTEPIDIVGRIRSFRKKVAVSHKREYEIINDLLVDVFIPIKEEFNQLELKDIPIKVLNAPANRFKIKILPKTASVTLTGPLKAIQSVKNDEILAYVDVVSLNPGSYQLPLQFNLPRYITLADPAQIVQVTVEGEQAPIVIP